MALPTNLHEARWHMAIAEVRNSVNDIDTTPVDVDIQRTTKEYFTRIKELAESLNQLTSQYIAITLTDLNKMQEVAIRVIERDEEISREIRSSDSFIDPTNQVQ